jgi:hypothetical protein
MDFDQAERRFAELKQQFDSGALSEEAFDEALKELMQQDKQGRWWALSRTSGKWNYYDDARSEWVAATPPGRVVTGPISSPEPQVVTGSVATAAAGAGTINSTMTIVIYIASLLVPLVGLILFFVYRNNPVEADRKVARNALILGIASIALSCICSIVYGAILGSSGFYY